MERGLEVLVGKLAIGRRLIAREDAVRCFYSSKGEPFWELAVRQGLLDRAQADDLVRTIGGGRLLCRGKCGAEYPLDAARLPESDRCPGCGGPLYVSRKPLPAPPSPAPALPPSLAPTIPPPPATDVGAEFAPTIPPTPRARPRPTNGDDLPSAIPIPRKTSKLMTPVHPDADTKDDEDQTKYAPPPSPVVPEFAPFSIGTYEVLAPIGKGGMGSVFKARHRALNQVVAIKIFTSHLASDDEQIKRFDREVKTMAKIDHPGVVRVRAGGIVREKGPFIDRPYYVMEFVEGRDLAAWLRERKRTPAECAALMARVCETVTHFHSKLPWIVHRDLKPQNVLVTREGDVPKICDFGLAKVEDSKLTRTGDIMGTPQFMPPEQALGRKNIGPPTDIYSLGAILYFLLVGDPPFNHSQLMPLMSMIERAPAPRVRERNPEVPAALESIVQKCLEKDPLKRFPFAKDLAVALAGLNLGG
jgi:serine/threonine-protein kinase